MFFVLSKLISWLIMPVSLICWALLGSLIIKDRLKKKLMLGLGIGMMLVFSNPYLAKKAMNSWEPDPKLYTDITEPYEWCVVLGGFTEPNRPPFDRAHFIKGADRLMHAIELYKLGKVNNILIAGGSGTLTFEGKKESTMIEAFALNAGVKRRNLYTESNSRNTRENAVYVQKFLSTQKRQNSVLLVTSAFHMKRAKGCFNEVGIQLDTFPTDYYGGEIRYSPDDLIIPKLFGLQIWTILIKEWVGLLAYMVVGYV